MINGQYIPALELLNVPGNMIPRGLRNFGGNERRTKDGRIINTFGQRNFVVKFDEEQGRALEEQGWDLFWFNRESEEDPLQAGLTVPVNLSTTTRDGRDRNPDTVIVVTDVNKVRQDEKTIGNLDGVTIVSADIRLTPRQKIKKDGTIKIAAYLNKMYVKIANDKFDAQYENLPWSDDAGMSMQEYYQRRNSGHLPDHLKG